MEAFLNEAAERAALTGAAPAGAWRLPEVVHAPGFDLYTGENAAKHAHEAGCASPCHISAWIILLRMSWHLRQLCLLAWWQVMALVEHESAIWAARATCLHPFLGIWRSSQAAGCRYDAYMTGAVFACLLPLLAAAADPEPAPVEAAAPAPPPLPALMPKPNLALGTALKKALRGPPGDGAQPVGAAAGDTAAPMAVDTPGVSREAPDSELEDASELAAELARGVAAGDAGAMQRLREAARQLREQPPMAPSLQPVQVMEKLFN